MKRRSVGKKMRFEVFKRDNFTCTYCGAKAPEAVLECDHVTPVFHDGKNVLENLPTACRDCNAGKGARLLEDRSTFQGQLAMPLRLPVLCAPVDPDYRRPSVRARAAERRTRRRQWRCR